MCHHPFVESKRAYVVPTRVEPLYKCYWAAKPGELFHLWILVQIELNFLNIGGAFD